MATLLFKNEDPRLARILSGIDRKVAEGIEWPDLVSWVFSPDHSDYFYDVIKEAFLKDVDCYESTHASRFDSVLQKFKNLKGDFLFSYMASARAAVAYKTSRSYQMVFDGIPDLAIYGVSGLTDIGFRALDKHRSRIHRWGSSAPSAHRQSEGRQYNALLNYMAWKHRLASGPVSISEGTIVGIEQAVDFGGYFYPKCVIQETPREERIFRKIEGILNYTANPMDYIPVNSLDSETPLYGVELETNSNASVSKLTRAFGVPFAICKGDSTIRGRFDYNAEIVTIPATLKQQRTAWAKFFSVAKDFKFDCNNSVGLHIHVSRKAFRSIQDNLHIRKFQFFFTNEANFPFLRALSGRPQDSRFAEYRKSEKITKLEADNQKYSVLNTRRSETLEVRMFAGIANYTHVVRSLELVDSLVEFTKVGSLSEMHWSKFVNWLGNSSRSSWRVLKDSLKEIDIQHDPIMDKIVLGAKLLRRGELNKFNALMVGVPVNYYPVLFKAMNAEGVDQSHMVFSRHEIKVNESVSNLPQHDDKYLSKWRA